MEDYLFISYAHKDKEKVLPIINYLEKSGLNIWFDGGIEIGTEFYEIIADKIKNCKALIIFISPSYVLSPNCNRETSYAVSMNKSAIVVYLEDTELSDVLKMNLGTWQAVNFSEYNSVENLSMEICKSSVVKVHYESTNKNENNVMIDPLVRRIFIFLEDEDWDKADSYCERMLDLEPENGLAYLGKLMIDYHISLRENLSLVSESFENNKNYKKVIRYGDKKLVEEVLEYNKRIKEKSISKRDLAVGDVFVFGSYEQSKKGRKDPIEWVVLTKDSDKILVISKNLLDSRPFNSEWCDVTWENCSLRKWLNEDFYNDAFNIEEREKIIATKVSSDVNPEYDVDSGKETYDKVFLLSILEKQKYFPSDNSGKCGATELAKLRGAYTSKITDSDGVFTGWWWLRTPGNNQSSAALVDCNGSILDDGNYVISGGGCIRPLICISFSK